MTVTQTPANQPPTAAFTFNCNDLDCSFFDHRVIDGAVGAGFLLTLRRYVENPYLLLV